MVMSPVELETMNHCAGEGQQQFTGRNYRCSVNTFPRQRRIVGGIVFYAVNVLSKESRRMVLTRTSCYILCKGPPIYNGDLLLSLKEEWRMYNIIICVDPSPLKILNQKRDFLKTWYKHHNCFLVNCEVLQLGGSLQTHCLLLTETSIPLLYLSSHASMPKSVICKNWT
jgi:hypothetical protein